MCKVKNFFVSGPAVLCIKSRVNKKYILNHICWDHTHRFGFVAVHVVLMQILLRDVFLFKKKKKNQQSLTFITSIKLPLDFWTQKESFLVLNSFTSISNSVISFILTRLCIKIQTQNCLSLWKELKRAANKRETIRKLVKGKFHKTKKNMKKTCLLCSYQNKFQCLQMLKPLTKYKKKKKNFAPDITFFTFSLANFWHKLLYLKGGTVEDYECA